MNIIEVKINSSTWLAAVYTNQEKAETYLEKIKGIHGENVTVKTIPVDRFPVYAIEYIQKDEEGKDLNYFKYTDAEGYSKLLAAKDDENWKLHFEYPEDYFHQFFLLQRSLNIRHEKEINYIATGKVSTGGSTGHFTRTKKEITVKLLPTSVYFEEYEGIVDVSAHLEAYFDSNEWDYKKDGLIYTDQLFWEGVRDLLKSIGIEHHGDFFYSEQGMQGDDYVDFDIGEDLARELLVKGLTYEDPYG